VHALRCGALDKQFHLRSGLGAQQSPANGLPGISLQSKGINKTKGRSQQARLDNNLGDLSQKWKRIPLAVIAVLFFLILKVVDPDAMLIVIIFTAMFVAMWIFVPRERPVRPRRAEATEPTARRTVPAPKALERLTDEAKKRKARSKRPLFEEEKRHEPFVDAVEKSTRHPAAQPQVRRKAQSKARKKKKKR
jgi:hypothetical protein